MTILLTISRPRENARRSPFPEILGAFLTPIVGTRRCAAGQSNYMCPRGMSASGLSRFRRQERARRRKDPSPAPARSGDFGWVGGAPRVGSELVSMTVKWILIAVSSARARGSRAWKTFHSPLLGLAMSPASQYLRFLHSQPRRCGTGRANIIFPHARQPSRPIPGHPSALPQTSANHKRN
jgi:hypothetical protein